MSEYFHHIMFDPLSEWERFKVGVEFLAVLAPIALLVMVFINRHRR